MKNDIDKQSQKELEEKLRNAKEQIKCGRTCKAIDVFEELEAMYDF